MVKIRTTPEEFRVEEQPPPPGLITEDDTKLPFAVFELTKTGWGNTGATICDIEKNWFTRVLMGHFWFERQKVSDISVDNNPEESRTKK